MRAVRAATPLHLRARPGHPAAPPAFGGPQPSRIICPGQFALEADRAASSADLVPAGGLPSRRTQSRAALARALAAQQEVLKFIPPGADEVPAGAFTSWEGRALYAQEPGRFRADRLAAVATAYREALAGYDA